MENEFMPPKQVITKGKILESACEILIEKGIENITARNIATKLNCSPQPIYWYFEDKQDLLHKVLLYVNEKYIEEMIGVLDKQDFFVEMIKWLIGISKKSRHLFSLLFYYNGYNDENLFDVMRDLVDNRVIIDRIKTTYHLGDNGAEYLYMRCCVLWAGVNSRRMRKGSFIRSEEEYIDFMKAMFDEAVEFAKRKN